MPRPKIPVEDRLEIMELFAYYAWGLNTGDAEEVLACFSSILQHNLDYRRNFVFGLASWDNVCTKASGEWLFKSVRIVKWMGGEVPWVGADRARTNAPTGPLI
jgi:hypothetical protein